VLVGMILVGGDGTSLCNHCDHGAATGCWDADGGMMSVFKGVFDGEFLHGRA